MPLTTTLLDLVQAVSTSAATDEETVATIVYLVNSGTVRLCGTFAGATITLPPSPPAHTCPYRNPNRLIKRERLGCGIASNCAAAV